MVTPTHQAVSEVPFDKFYGNWIAVAVTAGLFGLFTLGFLKPRRAVEWRSMGITQAFIVALFAEMYGVPLTVYLLSSLLDISPETFGFQESHLWAWLLARSGAVSLDAAVRTVSILSNWLIRIGMLLVVLGWYTIFRSKGELATTGIYRYLRHPQYLGLILVMTGFLVQWPTIPTLAMYPVLIIAYIRLAHVEEASLVQRFGRAFVDYRRRVPGFIPLATRAAPAATTRASRRPRGRRVNE